MVLFFAVKTFSIKINHIHKPILRFGYFTASGIQFVFKQTAIYFTRIKLYSTFGFEANFFTQL